MRIEQLESRYLMFGNDFAPLSLPLLPVAVDDAYAVVEDGALSVGNPGITVNDSKFDPQIGSIHLVNGPTNGILQNFNTTLGSFDYRPNLNFYGFDSFTYRLDDGIIGSNTATVTISVAPVNDQPMVQVATPDQLVWVGSPFELALPPSVFLDSDGDPLDIQVTRDDGSPLPGWLTYDAQQGKLHGVPLYRDIGVILLRVRATDPSQSTADDIFHLAVAAERGAPPKVESIVLNNGQAQRSKLSTIAIHFDGPVHVAQDAISIQRFVGATNSAIDGQISPINQTSSSVHGKTVVTLTFPSSADPSTLAPDIAGSLKDGRYRLLIDDVKVVSLNSYLNLDGDRDNSAGGDYLFGNFVTDKFFRFFGDHDGDADVDQTDLTQFDVGLQSSGPISPELLMFDGDGDGDIDLIDLGHFHKNFSRQI